MPCKPTIKTDHADLLNALENMQRSPLYALRRGVLRQAEQLIFAQEQRIRELEGASGTADQQASNERTATALRYFLGAAYRVDTTIHRRGYNWCEPYLDQARAFALANQPEADTNPSAAVPDALDSHNNADPFWLKTYKPHSGDELLALDVGYIHGWNACRAAMLAKDDA